MWQGPQCQTADACQLRLAANNPQKTYKAADLGKTNKNKNPKTYPF